MTSEMDKSLIDELARREVSVVFLDSGEAGLHMSNLRVGYGEGIKQAILHLAELGHRNVAFISGCRICVRRNGGSKRSDRRCRRFCPTRGADLHGRFSNRRRQARRPRNDSRR
jgi:DNA-binding LacI/PurR family transcriptional regulator